MKLKTIKNHDIICTEDLNTADTKDKLYIKPDENSGLEWIVVEDISKNRLRDGLLKISI